MITLVFLLVTITSKNRLSNPSLQFLCKDASPYSLLSQFSTKEIKHLNVVLHQLSKLSNDQMKSLLFFLPPRCSSTKSRTAVLIHKLINLRFIIVNCLADIAYTITFKPGSIRCRKPLFFTISNLSGNVSFHNLPQ